jgi:hypothetical protein
MKYFLPTFLLSIVLASCGGNQSNEESKQSTADSIAASSPCAYTYNAAPVEVLWVAYKYTDKTGVKGVFEEVTVSAKGTGASPVDVLNGAAISIVTSSSNSGDPTRDPKIQESFFGSLQSGETISGVITGADGNEQSGKLTADLTWNGVTKATEGSYSMTEQNIELKFELNVSDWSATDALNALNKVCEDLHKGSDGKSVLWPDVTVFVSTSFQKDCE